MKNKFKKRKTIFSFTGKNCFNYFNCFEKDMKRKTQFFQQRQIDGLLRKREPFQHTHHLSIFLFQSNEK